MIKVETVKLTFPITPELIAAQTAIAAASDRRRTIYMLIGGEERPIQSFLNTFMSNSYARPHKHLVNETFRCITGSFGVLTFNDEGSIAYKTILRPSQLASVGAGRFHTVVALEDGATLHEEKICVYNFDTDKVFAEFAPAEGGEGTAAYLEQLRSNFPA